MKIINHEHAVELVPDTEYERQALERLKNRDIQNLDWTDSWNRNGNLKINFREDDYGR